MSNLGKRTIHISEDVKVVYQPPFLYLEGEQGQLQLAIPKDLFLTFQNSSLLIKPRSFANGAQHWGTWQTRIQRAIVGVRAGFRTQLRLVGVGYRARLENSTLVLKLGFSHLVYLSIPEGISIECSKPTLISIKGIHWEKVYQFAAKIRAVRSPEPYKGKGICYKSEVIRRKEGKKT